VLHTHAALHEHGIEDRGLCRLVSRLLDANSPAGATVPLALTA